MHIALTSLFSHDKSNLFTGPHMAVLRASREPSAVGKGGQIRQTDTVNLFGVLRGMIFLVSE